jgi:hypothetical protein
METTLARVKLLAKTSTYFATTNPVLLIGEIGVANAGASVPVMKVGDGVRPWLALPDIVAAGAGADYVAGPVNTLPAGSPATVVIDNGVSPPTISFGIPAGATGPQGGVGPIGPVGPVGPIGAVGPANELSIGVVSTGAPGSAAAATITGTPPAQVLNLAIPAGIQGPVGAVGPAGPANSLAIGSVTTGAPGSAADATITGVPPNQTLSLTIPQGAQGIQGIQGPPGASGSGAPANPTAEVGLAAVNGVAVTFTRSDGAPALSQAIAPTWTGKHIFNNADGPITLASINPRQYWNQTNAAVDNRLWFTDVAGGQFRAYAANDAVTLATQWLGVTRSGMEIVKVEFGTNRLDITQSASAATSLDLFLNDKFSLANERLWRIRANTAGQLQWGALNDALSLGNNFMTVDRTAHVVDEVAFNATKVTVNAALYLTTQVNFTAGAAGFMEFVNRSAGDLGFRWYVGAVGTKNYMTLTSAGTLAVAAQMQAISLNYAGDTSRVYGFNAGLTYCGHYIQGTVNAFTGLIVYDATNNMSLMSNGTNSGIYIQGDTKWLLYRTNSSLAVCAYPLEGPSFNATSSRKIKRETGKPTRAAEMLSRLRPIMYRLLAKGSQEQLGMIAEEVAEICPQLSNGKTISYDRLAVLLLADWQESRGIHFAT